MTDSAQNRAMKRGQAFGSVIDLAGDSFQRRRGRGAEVPSHEALLADWERVGEDLWSTMSRLAGREIEP